MAQLIFSESNPKYIKLQNIMLVLSYVSSMIYLSMATHRDPRWEDRWAPQVWISNFFEIFFLGFMVLQFFKAFVPHGQRNEV